MIKKTFYLVITFVLSANIIWAQDAKKDTTKAWDLGSVSSFTINQTLLKYWVAGGQNSLAINAFSLAHANYSKNNLSWQNTLNLAYGLLKQQDLPLRKNDDKIELNSQLGYKAFHKFYYTLLFNFRTQFSPGYKYTKTDSTKISNFLAPGYLVFSAGMDYKPSSHFDLYASFISGRITIVTDPDLSAIGAYGVDSGKTVRYELGAYLKFHFNKEIIKNVTLISNVNLFSNYLHNPQNIDVNADVFVAYKATKYLTFNIKTNFIYDDDVKILINQETGQRGPRLQSMEIFGLGLTFKFPNK